MQILHTFIRKIKLQSKRSNSQENHKIGYLDTKHKIDRIANSHELCILFVYGKQQSAIYFVFVLFTQYRPEKKRILKRITVYRKMECINTKNIRDVKNENYGKYHKYQV